MRLSIPSPIDLFPTYLTQSLPFGRRKSSTDSSTSASSSGTADSTISSSNPQTFLTGHSSAIRCSRCLADLALADQIISKGFTGRHGRAYLVAPPRQLENVALSRGSRYGRLPDLPNTHTHKPVARNLVTGAHTVSDISCSQCGSMLGWKYVAAEEESQRYKVGKFILETKRICRNNCWEGDDNTIARETDPFPKDSIDQSQIEFDSEDENECEELFLGIWTPQTAARRRKAKAFARREE